MPGARPAAATRPMSRVADALREAERFLASRGVPDARLDAEVLLAGLLGTPRGLLPARFRDELPDPVRERFDRLLERRGERREPLQYLTGRQEFYSLEFAVDRRVLIPRPETELLVEALLGQARSEQRAGRRVALAADVGTGSGCVAVACAVNRPDLRLVATDLSAGALEVARGNARRHGVEARIAFLRGDLLGALAGDGARDRTCGTPRTGPLDAVLCNPPYVARGEMAGLQAEVREHEPPEALVSGPTGLEVYEALLPQAARVLRPGGLLAVELAGGRHRPVRALLEAGPWVEIALIEDARGLPRLLAAKRAGEVAA